MRRSLRPLFCFGLAVVAVAALAVPASAARRCEPVRDVIPGAGTNDAIHIRAAGTSCRIARSLPRPFIREMRSGGDGVIRAWRCVAVDNGSPWRASCTTRGGKRVTWRLG